MKLAIVVAFFLLLRFFPIAGHNFPYSYDNAKDSLVMQEMWIEKKPALLGAVTSMEGLYQGPFWYYLMFPLNLLVGFDPLGSVLTVISLGLITVWLLYRHCGFYEAFLFSLSSAAIATQQTAWSPYLTIFPTTWALILMTKIETKPKTIHFVLLAFAVSILFHAEIAFAVVFALLSAVVLIRQKIRPSFRQYAIAGLVFLLPFAPQVAFELRHDFLQTRSVLRFVTNYSEEKNKVQENKSGIARIGEVVTIMSQNAVGSISPYRTAFPDALAIVLVVIAILALYQKRKKIPHRVFEVVTPILAGSSLLYLFLPIKPFYLVGLVPFWIYIFAQYIRHQSKPIQISLLAVFTVLACSSMLQSRKEYAHLARETTVLLEPKIQAVDTAYRLSGGKPFASYQYVPEVYDYTYQHIYQYTARKNHRSLPTEYSYAPGEVAYMQTQKALGSSDRAESTILIVEADTRTQFFLPWWDKMTQGKEIVATEKINNAITVYQLK